MRSRNLLICYTQKVHAMRMLKKDPHSRVHCSTTLNIHKIEVTQVSTGWRVDKENLACVGAQWNIIQSLNEWNPVIYNNMDETGNHCESERNQAREWRAIRPQTEMESKLFTS